MWEKNNKLNVISSNDILSNISERKKKTLV